MTATSSQTPAPSSSASFPGAAGTRRPAAAAWRDRTLTLAAFCVVLAATFGLGPFAGSAPAGSAGERHAGLSHPSAE